MAYGDAARLMVLAALILVILHISTPFEQAYSLPLAYLYTFPWWRLMLALTFVAALAWCPWVGILFGSVLFFYFSDMGLLSMPIPNL
jgi:hypothetical protein